MPDPSESPATTISSPPPGRYAPDASLRYKPRKRTSGGNPDPTAVALTLWKHLTGAHAAVETHAVEVLAQHGLSLAEFGVLETLREWGPTKLGDLQRKLEVSSGGVTFLIDRLERKRLVERRSAPKDRRAKLATLTAEGTTTLEVVGPAYSDRIRESLASLSLAEQRSAIGMLRALAREAASLEFGTGSD